MCYSKFVSIPGQVKPLVLALAFLGAQPVLAKDIPDQESADLPPVVVSGERAGRALSDIAQGVSVVDGAAADVLTAGSELNPVIARTPNAFVQGPSELPTLRGVQGGGPGGLNSAAITGSLSRLPLVVDGVTRIPSLVNNSFSSLWDVRQVEVLRGPQSINRGRTGIAGAMVVDTYEPTRQFEAATQLGIRINEISDPTQHFNAMVSGPMGDTLAGRITLESTKGNDPRQVVGVNAPFLSEYDQLRLRAKLNGGSVASTAWQWLAEHEQGQAPQTRNFVELPSLTGRPYDERAVRSNAAIRAFDTRSSLLAFKTWTALGDNTLETVSSWGTNRFSPLPQQTFISRLGGFESQVATDALIRFNSGQTVKAAGTWTGLVGLGYEGRDQEFDATGAPLLASIDVKSNTFAVYSDFTYALRNDWRLQLGGRLQQFSDTRTIATTVLFPPPTAPVSGRTERNTDELLLLPSIGLIHDLDEVNTLGASLRRGFTPGGVSVNAFTGQAYQYDRETVWTSEFTWRNRARKNLDLGLTVFYNQFDNPQFYGEVVPGNRLSLQVFNQTEARSFGAELDAKWQATRDVRIDAALGLLNTEITRAASATPNAQGKGFGQDPSWTASVGALWNLPGPWSLDGRVNHIARAYNDFNNTPGTEVGDYTIVNAGVSYRMKSSQLRVFVNNALDETAFTRLVSGAGADVIAPRELGVSWTFFFD